MDFLKKNDPSELRGHLQGLASTEGSDAGPES